MPRSSWSGSATRAGSTARSRHNAGFMVAARLAERWEMRAKDKFGARITEGRIRPGGLRVVLMTPLTYMNESGKSAGPACGSRRSRSTGLSPSTTRSTCPSGEIRTWLGGGAAGTTASEPGNRASDRPVSGGSGSGSIDPIRPIPNASRPTCSGSSPKAGSRSRN